MRVARLHAAGDLRVGDEPDPVPGPGQTLVRVTDVGLCGSDLHWYMEGGVGDVVIGSPVVPGHEIAGVIAEGPEEGTPVAVDPAVPCGVCAMCLRGHHNLCPTVAFAGHGDLDGGLRELMAWPTRHLHRLPASLSTTDGAVLEPLGVAIHAVDLGHVRPASRVAVVGCGPIGLLAIEVSLASGATSVVAVDPLPHRRDAARDRGAEVALPAEAPRPTGFEADVAFELAGNDLAVDQAMRLVRPGGRVVLGGIPTDDRTSFPASLARRKGLTIVMARRMKEDVYERGARLVQSGRVDVAGLVTACYPLDRAGEAFESAAARGGLKVVVQPSA